MPTYFVDKAHPLASDTNPGTESLPWKTIRHAADVVVAGDTVYVKGNGVTYTESWSGASWSVPVLNPTNAGTAAKPITFRPYPGHSVTIFSSPGWQPAIGSTKDYVIWEGFTTNKAALGWNTGSELGYNHIFTTSPPNSDPTQIHAGIIVHRMVNGRIHHNIVHGFNGVNQNHTGIIAWQQGFGPLIVEDNYIYDNWTGIFTKDGDVGGIYRRNFITDNENASLWGNGQGVDATFEIYDNVLDNYINPLSRGDGHKFHDNLVRTSQYLSSFISDPTRLKNMEVFNNVIQSGTPKVWNAPFMPRDASQFTFFDYNVNTGAPSYTWRNETFNLSGMHGIGMEVHSQQNVPIGNIYDGSWTLNAAYRTAGRFGDAIGPGSGTDGLILEILDTTRYGPGALFSSSNLLPTASFTAAPTSGMAPLTVAVDGSASSDPDGTIATYTWNWGDSSSGSGVTASHVYDTAGTYTLVLTVTDNDGGTDTDTKTITVSEAANSPPTAVASITPTSGDAPLAVSASASGSFDSDGTIVSYQWAWGDGNASSGVTANHTYDTAGTYTAILTVTDNDGATGTDQVAITVTEPPVLPNVAPTAGFTVTPSSGLAPLEVNVSARHVQIIDNGDPGFAEVGAWTLYPDGYLSDHLYSDPGSGSDQVTWTFAVPPGEYQVSTTWTVFTNRATNAPYEILDNTTSLLAVAVNQDPAPQADVVVSGRNFQHIGGPVAISSGTLVVRLTDDANGYVIADAVRIERTDAFASTDSDGTIVSYVWNWGDGSSNSTGETATHTYSAAGNYTITLTVTDNDGATDTATATVSVVAAPNESPTASFTLSPTSGTAPLFVQVDSSASSDSDGTIVSRSWDWGDGSTDDVGVTAGHTYTSAGSYTITLTVTDDDGATGVATKVVTVSAAPPANQPPSAAFAASPTSGTIPFSVAVDASGSTDADGTIASYAWDWGDGTPGDSGVTATHVYNVAGSYTLTLTVTDDDAATDTATVQITASDPPNVPPVASFTVTPASGTRPLAVDVDASASLDTDGSIASYLWEWGDGTADGSSVTASHTFTVAGVYEIRLTVTDDDGETDTTTQTVTVNDPPVPPNVAPTAEFSATPVSGTAPLTVNVDAGGSSDSDGTIASYSWNWGDGTANGSGETTSHEYTVAGTYTLSLTVTDNDGATDLATATIQVSPVMVNQAPVASFTVSPASGFAPLSVVVDASASTDSDGTIANYFWNWGDGSNNAIGQQAMHIYEAAGSYTITLTVVDDDGASHSTSLGIAVAATPTIPNPAPVLQVGLQDRALWVGYYQLGDLLSIAIWTLDATQVPHQPDAAPLIHVYGPSGSAVLTRSIPVVDTGDVTGFFLYRVNLDENYAPGRYAVLASYEIDEVPYSDLRVFEILAGGNPEGNGIAMHFFRQPAADYVLLQTDQGTLKRLRNPAVRGD